MGYVNLGMYTIETESETESGVICDLWMEAGDVTLFLNYSSTLGSALRGTLLPSPDQHLP